MSSIQFNTGSSQTATTMSAMCWPLCFPCDTSIST